MESILAVTMSDLQRYPYGVKIHLAFDVSTDEDDDEDMPEIDYKAITFSIHDRALSKGREFANGTVMEQIEKLRMNFTAKGYERLYGTVSEYLARHDVTSLAEPFIPEPTNRWKH